MDHQGNLKVLDNMRLCGDRDISNSISTPPAFFDSKFSIIIPRQHITKNHGPPTSILWTPPHWPAVVSLACIAAGDDLPQSGGGHNTSTRPRNSCETLHRGLAHRSSTTGSAMGIWPFVGVRMPLARIDDVSRVFAASYCMSVQDRTPPRSVGIAPLDAALVSTASSTRARNEPWSLNVVPYQSAAA
jgi:hypothetical protein